MEKTFKEVMNTIKEGETWVSKNPSRRLARIQKFYDSISFVFNNTYTDVAVNQNDVYVLERKKYTFEEAMKALKEGKEIESCASETKYIISSKLGGYILFYDTERKEWLTAFRMFGHSEIFGDWYIND